MRDFFLAFGVVTFSVLLVGAVVALIIWISMKFDGGER